MKPRVRCQKHLRIGAVLVRQLEGTVLNRKVARNPSAPRFPRKRLLPEGMRGARVELCNSNPARPKRIRPVHHWSRLDLEQRAFAALEAQAMVLQSQPRLRRDGHSMDDQEAHTLSLVNQVLLPSNQQLPARKEVYRQYRGQNGQA